jgi:integrase
LLRSSPTSNQTVWEIALLLAGTTGARRSEVLGLAWSAVDLEAGRIRITRTLQKGEGGNGPELLEPKTDRSRRELVLLHVVAERLRRHRAEQLERRLALGDAWRLATHGRISTSCAIAVTACG